MVLIILSLFPSYIFGRCGQASSFNENHPTLAKWFRRISTTFDVAMEINLAIFYTRGTYYDLMKRFMGIQHVSRPNSHFISLLIIPVQPFRYHHILQTHIQGLHLIHFLE